MVYATTNPPHRVWGEMAGNSGWFYASTDQASDVDASGYFTNGDALGMQIGDVMYIIDTDNTNLLVMASVTVVAAGGAATVVTI